MSVSDRGETTSVKTIVLQFYSFRSIRRRSSSVQHCYSPCSPCSRKWCYRGSALAIGMVRGHGILSRHPAPGLRICRYSNPLCTWPARLLIHLAVMLGGAIFLPVAIAKGWVRRQPTVSNCFCSVCSVFPSASPSSRCPLTDPCCKRGSLARSWTGRKSLFSLRGEQYRQPSGIICIPVRC